MLKLAAEARPGYLMGMFCRKCGRQLTSGQPFCKFCGASAPVRTLQASSPAPPKTPTPEILKLALTPVESKQIQDIIRPVTVPYLACKVCERGELVSKKIYRLTRPVVAIGYILLIPSILGMIASALLLFGVIAYNGDESSTTMNHPAQSATTQEDFDTHFRRTCLTEWRGGDLFASASLLRKEQFCECMLGTAKKGGDESVLANGTTLVPIARVCAPTLDGVIGSPYSDQELQNLFFPQPPQTATPESPNLLAGESSQFSQEDFNNGFRRGCVNSAGQSYQHTTGISAQPLAMGQMEQICECALTLIKTLGTELGSDPEKTAAQACLQRFKDGSLAALDQQTQNLYASLRENSAPPRQRSSLLNLFHIIGGGFAISLGVASFVGGLLGWLLIMKKRVLQCSACGATVSAS